MRNLTQINFRIAALLFAATTIVASCDKNDNGIDNDIDNGASVSGVVINGITWATCNVDAPGTFAASPESAGKFYRWNNSIAWPASGNVANWPNSATNAAWYWYISNDPCPSGWRVPTLSELNSLVKSGSKWTSINGVTGRIFGSDSNTIFLPACGYRDGDQGTLKNAGIRGNYWSSTEQNSSGAHELEFASGYAYAGFNEYYIFRRCGRSVRCVAE
ncbi:MAG: fibrobacter succinogenes major paralogous domain-containing protein [Bacteroidales bacterium]|jgi:uncharacterized protein (TIGR02145 family)|nr:fibrobacter succinogenes major paralogous domain-containing protein [Bacteroidales bacterium]